MESSTLRNDSHTQLQRLFPNSKPQDRKLGRVKVNLLNVAGGNIRSSVVNVAFLGVDANDAVTMYYMLEAAKSEYIKLERSLTDTEGMSF